MIKCLSFHHRSIAAMMNNCQSELRVKQFITKHFFLSLDFTLNTKSKTAIYLVIGIYDHVQGYANRESTQKCSILKTGGKEWKHPVSSLWDSFYSPTLANNGYFFTTNIMQSITAYSLFGGLDSKKLDFFFISPLLIFDQYPTAVCSNPIENIFTFLIRNVLTKSSKMLHKWLR